ncbi:MAG: FecR domain-containing protein [Nitrospirae bacterium]|nr:FecR domain-containing protein [Nitrospirota bacterium]
MSKGFSIFVLCSVLLLFLFSMVFPLPASAAGAFVGNIKSIEAAGTYNVNIIRAGKPVPVAAKIGDALFEGDTIKTGSSSKVQLLLSDNTTIYVAQNSNLMIKEYLLNHTQNKRNVVVKSDEGKIRMVVMKMFRAIAATADKQWKSSNVRIETPTAVAGIKGTDLVIVVSRTHTQLTVFEGVVGIRNMLSSVRGEAIVGANQTSTVKKDAPPAPPVVITPQQKQQLLKDTTPELKAEKDSGKKSGAKETKETKKDKDKDKEAKETKIKADLADKSKPVQDAINKAVKSGMSLEDAIAAAIKAGADPATVVYAAIQAGYSAQQVVSAAIKAGAPLAAVVNAAVIAGADSKAIVQGAVDAGVAPAVAADTVAVATSSESPAFGYEQPAAEPAPMPSPGTITPPPGTSPASSS